LRGRRILQGIEVDDDFAGAGAVFGPNNSLLLHEVHDAGRTVVPDAQAALDHRGGGAFGGLDHLERLIVELLVVAQILVGTILDGKGADTLIGRGDMLFSPPGSSRLVRAQGAFVSDEEVNEFVEFLKRNGPPQYAQSVQQQIDRDASADDEDGDESDDDLGDDQELYDQALEVIKSTKRASTSMIQRRLRIGYNRAARIMDLMEQKGIVGPENGSSPREIIVDLDSL
jgi:DNA segregation ATPase FtsK/SpoIIIE-like protein